MSIFGNSDTLRGHTLSNNKLDYKIYQTPDSSQRNNQQERKKRNQKYSPSLKVLPMEEKMSKEELHEATRLIV